MNTPIAGLPLLLSSSLKIAIMFGVVMLTVAYTTLAAAITLRRYRGTV